MNRHFKLAIVIAPFLGIGAYVATGYYAETKLEQERFLKLLPEGDCRILEGDCKLHSGKFRINLSHQGGITRLATTHEIEHAVISHFDNNQQEKLYKLEYEENLLNWKGKTELGKALDARPVQPIRILMTIKKASYLGETNTSP